MIISNVIIFDYLNIKNQAFLFDPIFEFSSLKDNTITIKQKPHFHNHLSEGIQINAIIGENGAGKTTVLNALTYILSGEANFEYVLILRDDSTFLHNSTLDNLKISKKRAFGAKKIDIGAKKIDIDALLKLQLSTILYSNVKSTTTWYLNEKISILTESYLAKCSKWECDYHYGEEISENDAHELNDISRQISYFSNEGVKELEITIPNSLDFEISKLYEEILSGENREHIELFEFWRPIEKYNQLPPGKVRSIGEYYLIFILNFLRDISATMKNIQYAKLDKENIEQINSSLNNNDYSIDFFKDILKKYSNKSFLMEIFKNVVYYNDLEIEKIKTSFSKKKKFIEFLEKNTAEKSISINDKTNIKKLVRLYSESVYKSQYLTLKWQGLSSGENAKLNFYSRIYERIHNKLKTLNADFIPTKNLIVLIDEGATFYHPEWQRSYIYDVNKFFKDVIIKSSLVENIHLILTSHSPFVISDLTRDQIVYLRKEKQPNSNFNFCKVLNTDDKPLSFAGNINSLYRYSFFLQDTLTGKYSHEVLDEIINKLIQKNTDLNLDLVEYLLSETSEPILKNHISKLLEKYKQEV